MKKIIIAILLISLGSLQAIEAKGIPLPILYSSGETLSEIKELPEDCTIDKEHVNLGVIYEQFALFGIPIWNYGETKNVLINEKKDTYWDLDSETIQILRDDYGVEVPEKASVPFWTQVGGKPIIVLIIITLIYSSFIKKEEEEEKEEESLDKQE